MSIEYKGPLNKLGARYFNAPGFPQYLADLAHISNAITIPASAKIFHVVGHVGANDDYTVSPDPKTQFRQVFENTAKALVAAGVEEGWNAVFSATAYLAPLEGEKSEDLVPIFGEVWKEFVGNNKPLVTMIVVKETAWPGARFEMQSQATLKD